MFLQRKQWDEDLERRVSAVIVVVPIQKGEKTFI